MKELVIKIINWLLKLDPVCAVEVPDPEHYDPRDYQQ